jgi:accessory colonization factor AcfC
MMKIFKVIILLFALALSAKINAQTRLFSDLTDDTKIQTTFVGPTMLKLATGLVGTSAGALADSQIDISKIINNISSVEVVKTVNNKGKVKKIQKALKNVIKTYNVQTIVDSPNGDNNTQVLGVIDDYTGVASKLFIVKKDKKNMQVVVVQGAINLTDIASLINY